MQSIFEKYFTNTSLFNGRFARYLIFTKIKKKRVEFI